MASANWLKWIFILNATVLCTHQIDAAYWHEWELFHIPGGNQLNLILNLPIILSVFIAFGHVISSSPRAKFAHVYLAFLGILTVVLHTGFFVFGHQEFRQTMSIVLILSTAALSVIQLFLTMLLSKKISSKIRT